MTAFHRQRRMKARNEFLRKKIPTKAKEVQPPPPRRPWTIKHLRDTLTGNGRSRKSFLPVDLDPLTMRWMKKKYELVLGTNETVTWLELANAWLGCNDLLDVYATADSSAEHLTEAEKRYAFMDALNRLQSRPQASCKIISNWDDAAAFIELEMNLPADQNEPHSDAFIQRMEQIEIDLQVLQNRPSVALWNKITRRFVRPIKEKEDDDMELDDRLQTAQQAEIERNNMIEVEQEKVESGYTIIPISENDCQKIREVMHGGYEDDVVTQVEGDTVQRRSLATLMPGQWLNDEVIHAYLQLLSCDKQHFFKSFFVTMLLNENVPGKHGVYQYGNVKRWSKKIKGKDIFAMEKVFFPVNQGNTHWTLAVAFVQERRLQFYDSMGGSGRQYLVELEHYFNDEHKDKKKAADSRKWTLVPCTADTPRQRNVVDCGVFVCMFSEFLSRDRPLTFSQDDIYNCRDRIAYSLLTKTPAM